MELKHAQSCSDCIHRHIGPALNEAYESVGVGPCGGCGRTIELVRFSYWFPWPDEEDWDV